MKREFGNRLVGCIIPMALVWIWLSGACSIGKAQSGDEVDRMIDQLGSPRYAERMAAWGELRALGSSVRARLAAQLPKADRELASRLRELIGLIDLRIPDSMPAEVLGLLLSFPEQGEEAQTETLTSLVRLGQYRLIFDVIGMSGNANAYAERLYDSFSISSVLWEFIQKDDWSGLREIVEHPVCRQLYPQYQLAWWVANGECDERLIELRQLVANGGAGAEEIKALISLLRYSRRSQEALGVLGSWEGAAGFTGLDRRLRMESGDWASILTEQAPLERPENELEDHILGMRLLVSKFAEDEGIYAGTFEEIKRRISGKDPGADEGELFQSAFTPALLATMEIDTALPLIRQSSRQSAAELLQYLNRYAEAEQALGIAGSLDDRLKRIETRFNTFRRNSADYERTGGSAVLERLEQAWSLSLATATLLENEGVGTQAEFVLQAASEAIDGQTYEHDERVAALLGLGVQMRNSRLIDSILSRHLNNESNIYRICESLFPAKSQEAMFWIYRLTDLNVDLPKQVRLTAQLLNEPYLLNEQALNLRQWLTENQDRFHVSGELADDREGGQEYVLARTYYFHGLRDEALKHLGYAISQGHASAVAWKGEMTFENAQWLEAAELNERLCKMESADLAQSCLACMRAAFAREKMGDRERAQKNRFAAFVGFENAGLNGNHLNTVKDSGLSELLNQILRINLATLDFQNARNSMRLYFLNTAAVTCMPGDAEQSLACVRQLLFDVVAEGTNVSSVFVADLSMRECLLDAMNLWRNGKIEEAVGEFRRAIRLRPANASVAEDYLAGLGQSALGPRRDQLLQELQASFLGELARYPTSALLLNNFAWGNVCLAADLDLSARAAAQAVALRQHHSSYLDTLAEVEFQRGNIARAIELIEECVQLQPDRSHYRQQMKKFLDAKN